MKMQRESETRAMGDPFDIFGGFGNFGGFSLGFGRGPFDDPFFTRPFKAIYSRPGPTTNESSSCPTSRAPVIHELNSDDEQEEQEDEGAMDNKEPRVNKQPWVDYPDEEPEVGNSEHVAHRALNRVEATRAQNFQYHSCKVTYGGVDGAYYSSSTTRRMAGDGALMEECKEADRRTGEAKHRISRGIQNKGHSLTRKLNSDGEVEALQTLHNLNEDELERFEDLWRGNAGKHTPSLGNASITHTGAGFGGRGMLPSSSRGAARAEVCNSSIGRQPKKVVRIDIE